MKIIAVNNNFNISIAKKSASEISFKGEFDDRVQALRSDYNSVTWWLYGEKDSKELVARNMRGEIYELEKDVAREEVKTDGAKKSYEALKNNNAEFLRTKRRELTTLNNLVRNNNATISNLQESLSNLSLIHNNMQKSNENYISTIQKQNTEKENFVKKEKEIKASQERQERKMQADLDEKLNELRQKSDDEILELSLRVDENIAVPNKIMREISCPKPKGFGSIPGYKAEKEQIKKFFGQAVILEKYKKAADVPNGILLFSPDKNFMEDFATSIAHQYDCNIIKVENQPDIVKRMKILREAATGAQSHFEKNNQRSVILIKDFDEFAPKNTRIVGPLKSFIDNLSKSSHATVIATSTHPENLDDILLRTGRFDIKMPLPLLNDENLRDLIRMTLDASTLATVNIEELMQNIKALRLNEKLNIKSMRIIIKNMIPVFKNETVKLFESQKAYMKKI